MAHESFEDPEIAAMMNRLFVNVKVDREERPDIDAVYMDAVQALTGHGGWPMTVFLTPDGRPFYGGTYFPPADRGGMPGFPRIMDAIADVWTNRRDDVAEQTEQLVDRDRGQHPRRPASRRRRPTLHFAVLDRAYEGCRPRSTRVDGGFGRAPKFPPSMTLDFLLRCHVRGDAPDALPWSPPRSTRWRPVASTTTSAAGSPATRPTRVWLVPHFEKMLYDQALLVGAYLRGHLVTGTATATARSSRRRSTTCCAISPPRRRVLLGRGRRLGGRRGQVLPLVARRDRRGLRRRTRPTVLRFFGVTAAGNFADPHTAVLGRILHQVDRLESRPDAVGAALVRALRGPRRSGCGPGSTTRCSRRGTPCSPGR